MASCSIIGAKEEICMEKVLDLIKQQRLFRPKSTVGVATSGGSDSMALLHFLYSHKEELNINVLAINVIHGTRDNDEVEARFVSNYCRDNEIEFAKYRVEAGVISMKEGITLEDACRKARYGIFEALKQKGVVDYIALAHHERDQAETILLHILRGSGLKGASGMSLIRDDFYVRPFLTTTKEQILEYLEANGIQYLEDETNTDTKISRNFLRVEIMPKLREVWPNLDNALANFGRICREDDECIRQMINFDAILHQGDVVKIPLTYFVYQKPLIFRMLADAVSSLGVEKDFETKHFEMMIDLVERCENGAKVNLPQGVDAHKEYEYLTITRKKPKFDVDVEWNFKVGTTKIGDYGKLSVKKAKSAQFDMGLVIDLDKLPNGAKWRMRKEGDYIEKFGGGTKKLKAYLVDKKIPVRLRDCLPVLAIGNEVLVVAGVDISEQLRITEDTQNFGIIKYDLENWA